MPYSLKVKIKGLQYKGIITDRDCDRLCKALDSENVLDKIRAEIENVLPKAKFQTGKTSVDVQMMIPQEKVLQIIDKYKEESEK